jgi:GT2 family glycosyltransferase
VDHVGSYRQRHLSFPDKNVLDLTVVYDTGLVWKLALPFRHVIDTCFPLGTRKRNILESIVIAISIGTNEGVRSLIHEVARYIDRKLNNPYDRWLMNNQLTNEARLRLQGEAGRFRYKPLISIIMPVFNSSEQWLNDAIRSVSNQIYSNWELCIVDDASTTPPRRVLEEAAESDNRVKLKFLHEKLGISGASNQALRMTEGEFVGFLDHDDELSNDALFHVVRLLNQNRKLDVIYSDEDKTSRTGRKVEPFFKPDWSPDLLLSMNYLSHFTVIRKHMISKAGGFRRGFEGSQDYDLVLRVTELTGRIEHIQRPLYHWRKTAASTASFANAKPYARQSTIKSLNEALGRREIKGKAVDGFAYYRVKYDIRGTPLVSIIIPTRNNVQLLQRCVESIEAKTTYENYEIIIVDNGSTDAYTLSYLKRTHHQVVNFNQPFNFSKINNYTARHVNGRHLLFLNDDTEVVNGDWLQALLEHSQRPEVGIVGGLLLYPGRNIDSSRIQHAGVVIGVGGVAGHAFRRQLFGSDNYFNLHRVIRDCSAVTAACAMTRRDVFQSIGGFDERFRVAFGDIDLCLRLREKGYLVVYTPYSILYHNESASRGKLHPIEDESLAIARWSPEILRGDPYYNSNLTLLKEDYSLTSGRQVSRPLSLLLDLWFQNYRLERAFPEVNRGDYKRLIRWAVNDSAEAGSIGVPLRAYAKYLTQQEQVLKR